MNYSYFPDNHQLNLLSTTHATMSMSRAYTDLNDSVIFDSVQYSPVNANQNLATMLPSSPYHTIPQYQPQTEFLPYMWPSYVDNNLYMTADYDPVMEQPSYCPYCGYQSYYYSSCYCCYYSQAPPPPPDPQVMGYYGWMQPYDVRPSPAYDDDLVPVDDDYDLVSGMQPYDVRPSPAYDDDLVDDDYDLVSGMQPYNVRPSPAYDDDLVDDEYDLVSGMQPYNVRPSPSYDDDLVDDDYDLVSGMQPYDVRSSPSLWPAYNDVDDDYDLVSGMQPYDVRPSPSLWPAYDDVDDNYDLVLSGMQGMQPYYVRPSPSLGQAYDDDLVDDDYDLVPEFSNGSFDDYEDFHDFQELMGRVNVGRVNVGLSKETISKKLKTSRVKDVGEDGEVCVVCQDEYKLKEIIATLDCGHRYHANCINQWLLRKNECAICKAKALFT